MMTSESGLHLGNSRVAVLIGKMERLHEKMQRGFWIGNQMVWCFRGLNPAPETLLICVIKDLLEELEQPGFVQANHSKCFMETATESKWSSFHNMIDNLDDILLKCYSMEEQRLTACLFLGKYGVWFWRLVLSVCTARYVTIE